MNFNENSLELAFVEILEKELGYEYLKGAECVPGGITPERSSYNEVILESRLENSLRKLNPHLPTVALHEALRKVKSFESQSLIENNRRFHHFLSRGVEVNYSEHGQSKSGTAYLVDFKNVNNNDFLVINQFTVVERSNRRFDIVVFINGLPLVVMELKTLEESIPLEHAYNDFETYKKDIPTLFSYNAFLVISDGIEAKAGTLTSNYNRFMSWKSIDGEYENKNSMMMEYLLKGMFERSRVVDIIRFFILFQSVAESYDKVLGAYHQYFAVNRAVTSTVQAIGTTKKAGVVWHTQGSGKSLSMVMYAGKLIQTLDNPTIVVLTDRNDLDEQLFSTFSKARDFLGCTPIQIDSRENLRKELQRASGGIIFTTIQKFTLEEGEVRMDRLSDRENIILMADEAHRSQYGLEAKLQRDTGKITYGYAKHVKDALPNATYIGFTGTPIENDDRSTREVFGEYIDIYDMTQAVEDGATVKIYYENRIASLNLNETILKKIDEEYEKFESEGVDSYTLEKSKGSFSTLETIVGDSDRLEMVASDIIAHFEDKEKILNGKAMIVAMSRKIACEFYEIITSKRSAWHSSDLLKGKIKVVITGNKSDSEQIKKHVYEKYERDILAKRMKDLHDELKIVIVVDMWLTGFDVPCMHTLYVDKMMQGHNLMQAIARVNRVFEGKEGGTVVDYIGLFSKLKEALKVYTKRDQGQIELNLYEVLKKFETVLETLNAQFHGVNIGEFFEESELSRLRAIRTGADFVLEQDRIDTNQQLEKEKRFKTEFFKNVKELSIAEKLALSLLSEKQKMYVSYFKAVKSTVAKITMGESGVSSLEQVNARIGELVQASIERDTLIPVSDILGISSEELNIFDEKFLAEIRAMKEKNLALELIRKLLSGKIKALAKSNIVQSEKFSSMLSGLMNRYNNQALSNAEIIEELLKMSQSIKKATEEGTTLGLSQEEVAFYDALTYFETVHEVFTEEILKEMAHELTEKIKSSRSVDWDIKSSARAEMRKVIKRLLKKYHYPPEHTKDALELVIKQVELQCQNEENK